MIIRDVLGIFLPPFFSRISLVRPIRLYQTIYQTIKIVKYNLPVPIFPDGDTIKIVNDGKTSTIRLVGIDAPETSKKKNQPGQPFSQRSTKYLADLVLNRSVEIKSYGTDRYGRTLGAVYLDGKNINLEIVRVGLAEVYRGSPAKGLDLYSYKKAEEEAREAVRGIWSLGDRYVSPREWRRIHK